MWIVEIWPYKKNHRNNIYAPANDRERFDSTFGRKRVNIFELASCRLDLNCPQTAVCGITEFRVLSSAL